MASEPGEPCSVLLTDRPLLESSLEALHNADLTQAEQAVNTYCKTLDHYLELSTLLDPILNAHVITLCALTTARLEFFIANIPPTPDSPSHLAVELPCRALYGLIKVRGVKCVSPHLPHQVHNLRFLISALNAVLSQVYSDSFWHVRYILLVWLAVAIRAPFPIHTILQDSVVSEVVTHSQAALSAPGRVAIAAAVFLARLLARRDTLSHRISLLHWAVTHSLQLSAPSDTRIAGLSLLAATFKLAHRDDLQPHVQPVLDALAALAEAPATKVESHLITKLSQRVALAFLPPRPAAWRYRRNTRVILSRPCGHVGPVLEAEEPFVSEQDAEALEAVIDQLLTALQHRDTVVRWSAAKGIGRITARLPLPLARDVIYSVLDLFTNHDESRADACCHGACLALAELARRGLLLPSDPHFGMVFTAVKKAASFDVRRGASSIGSHVRDAACYVVWAMARVYSKEDIAPFASSITDSMLPVALLDREVNCRRAASAALQECVGRLSENLFMDGIQLITTADYFSLGDRSAVYLKISPKVSTLASGAYFDCITKDLWSKKLVHWDRGIRALAAKALARFVLIDKDSVILRDIIPKLVNFATQKYVDALSFAFKALLICSFFYLVSKMPSMFYNGKSDRKYYIVFFASLVCFYEGVI